MTAETVKQKETAVAWEWLCKHVRYCAVAQWMPRDLRCSYMQQLQSDSRLEEWVIEESQLLEALLSNAKWNCEISASQRGPEPWNVETVECKQRTSSNYLY
jgi:hypothetical protein